MLYQKLRKPRATKFKSSHRLHHYIGYLVQDEGMRAGVKNYTAIQQDIIQRK